jgi:guanylate kinase
MREAVSEMSHYAEFDYLVINDIFDAALAELDCIVRSQRLRTPNQIHEHAGRIERLLGTTSDPGTHKDP